MSEKKCGVYKITNVVNGKMLIGQSANIDRRWNNYRCQLRKHKYANDYLQRSWNKYGEQNFLFEIVLLCPIGNLNDEEIRFIKEYDTMNPDKGYNLEAGGRNPEVTEETRKKLSIIHKGRQTGADNPMFGKPVSEETRRKISKANKGKGHSEDWKRKLSNALKGRIISDEWRKKISQTLTGRIMPEETKIKLRQANTGFKHSKESRAKMSLAQKGKIVTEEAKLNMIEGQRRRRQNAKPKPSV